MLGYGHLHVVIWEKTDIYMWRRETSGETGPAHTLISDFKPSGQGENKFLLFKPLVYRTLVWWSYRTNKPWMFLLLPVGQYLSTRRASKKSQHPSRSMKSVRSHVSQCWEPAIDSDGIIRSCFLMNRNIETGLMGWLPCSPFLGWEEEKVWAETAINLCLSSWESWPWLWESALENVCRPCTLSSGVMAASIHGGDDILHGVIFCIIWAQAKSLDFP